MNCKKCWKRTSLPLDSARCNAHQQILNGRHILWFEDIGRVSMFVQNCDRPFVHQQVITGRLVADVPARDSNH